MMDAKTLPIGTVIAVADQQAVIVGYHMPEREGKSSFSYLVVPFPLGYTNNNSVKILGEVDFELIQIGFQGKKGMIFSQCIDRLRQSPQQLSADELKRVIEQTMKDAARKAGKEQV